MNATDYRIEESHFIFGVIGGLAMLASAYMLILTSALAG